MAAPEVRNGAVTAVRIVLNPEKLAFLAGQLGIDGLDPAHLRALITEYVDR